MSKPKTKPKTGSELELERRQRTELDKLTRENNATLKAIKQGRQGEKSLFATVRTDQGNRPGDGVVTRAPIGQTERALDTVAKATGLKRGKKKTSGILSSGRQQGAS